MLTLLFPLAGWWSQLRDVLPGLLGLLGPSQEASVPPPPPGGESGGSCVDPNGCKP